MTQYLMSVHGRIGDPAPDPEVMQQAYARTDAFNDELKQAGSWVFAGGLHSIDTATTVDATSGTPKVTDGPYSESKEFLGGFWVVECADMDAALALAERASFACGGAVEVRPFQDMPEA
jgi:hypothetical protein